MKLKYNDEYHSYWLDGKRCKSVTTVAKIPDDTYRLEQWAKRQVAIGLASTPVLVEAIAAHFDDRQQVDKYCEQAMEAAKAHGGATRGTAAHRITERHDLGEPIMDTPLSAYVVGSWKAALEASGLEVVRDYIERIVVYPDLAIAGRFDRLCRRKADGRLVVVDVKGGQRAIEYPHSIACQMGLYANAPLLAGPLPANGGETEQFEPMPDVDRGWGYIFHLPEEGDAAVARVDIAAGWRITGRAIFPILEWRRRNDLCEPVATIVGDNPRRQVLVERIKALPPDGLEELAKLWPLNVPTMRASSSHTAAELEQIEAAVDKAGWAHGDPKGIDAPHEPRPEPEPEPDVPPAAMRFHEGGMIDEATIEAFKKTIPELAPDVRSQIEAWVKESHAAGVTFSLSRQENRTVRRFEIMRAAIGLAVYDDDIARAVIGLVLGAEIPLLVTVGQALGLLTINEAASLYEITQTIGRTHFVSYEDGKPTIKAA